MAGAWINDDEGAMLRVCLDASGWGDLDEGIVRGPLELTGISNHFPVEIQQRRLAGFFVLDPVVAALAQRVPEQDRALGEVEPIGTGIAPEVEGRRRVGPALQQWLARGFHRIDVALNCVRTPLLIDFGELRLCTGDLHQSRLYTILASLSSGFGLSHRSCPIKIAFQK
jgi:hypothetical protein